MVGLGKSGVASALFLKARGAKVTVSDSKSEAELLNIFRCCWITEYRWRPVDTATGRFGQQDLIVISPGVPVIRR